MKILNGQTHYSSFGEAYVDLYGEKKKKFQLKQSTKEKFINKHKCRACKQPLTWIPNTSVMMCQNPKCKGIKHERYGEDGKQDFYYTQSYCLLDDIGVSLATKIYD